jgi:hypothetical protein
MVRVLILRAIGSASSKTLVPAVSQVRYSRGALPGFPVRASYRRRWAGGRALQHWQLTHASPLRIGV